MYAHQVLIDCVSDAERRLDLLRSIHVISHLEGEFRLLTQAVSRFWRVLVQNTDSVILPVKFGNDMKRVLLLVKVLVPLQDVGQMDVESVCVGLIH